MRLISKQLLTFFLAIVVAFTIILVRGQTASAQLSIPNGLNSQNGDRLPVEVIRYGNIEVTPVRSPLDGKILFTIASPTVQNRTDNDAGEQLPVEQRAEEVTTRLRRVFLREFNSAFLLELDLKQLKVEVSRLNNVTIITARIENRSQPIVLVSITNPDAEYHIKPIDELAEEWRKILEQELRGGFEQFSKKALENNLKQIAIIILGLVILSFVVWLIKYLGSLRQESLKKKYQREMADSLTAEESLELSQARPSLGWEGILFNKHRHAFLTQVKRTFAIDHRLEVWNFIQWCLVWVLILAWYLGFYHISSLIPFVTKWSDSALNIPIKLLAVWFLGGLAIRVSRSFINRLSISWQKNSPVRFFSTDDEQRWQLRVSTIANALQGMITVLIAIVSLLTILSVFGIPAGSVLAIGGLFGLAISFGSQSLVKDLVNGFLILAEDQYAIGDVIDLGGVSGLVENLNLRVTQLRNANGELITVPNSTITEVKNMTRTWSRVNFSIDIAYETDPENALSVLKDVGQGLYDDPEWHDKIIAPPDVLGIDHLSHSGITITIWIQTIPAQQWAVGREFRVRVWKALAANNIKIGVPQQAYTLGSSSVPQ